MAVLRKPGTEKLLQRLLSDSNLPEKVRSLSPAALSRLIDQVGLEDCAEIVALASVEQISRVFDEDLWKSSAPGADENFDPARFGLWLEILLELGPAFAAEKIAEMDPDFVTMAISQLVLVIAFEDLREEVASQSLLEKVMSSSHVHELEEFMIFARESSSWDAVLTLLVELDRDHHSLLRSILERCAYFAIEIIEESGGLFSILTSEEQLKSDVAYEREKRREAEGYVTPADARAFLKLAAGPIETEDHISPARFRTTIRSSLMTESNAVNKNHSRALVLSEKSDFAAVHAFLERDNAPRSLKMEELNYLANVIVSGGVLNGRSPRAGEAARIVLETCEKGLKARPACKSFIEAFRSGWAKTAQ